MHSYVILNGVRNLAHHNKQYMIVLLHVLLTDFFSDYWSVEGDNLCSPDNSLPALPAIRPSKAVFLFQYSYIFSVLSLLHPQSAVESGLNHLSNP